MGCKDSKILVDFYAPLFLIPKLKKKHFLFKVKVEKLPIIWLHVDLLNEEKNKDQSFILKSSQKEENSPDVFTFSTCCPINKDLVVS